MTARNVIQTILADLSPSQQAELGDLLTSLHAVGTQDGEIKPDGINNVLGMVSPEVKQKFFQLHQLTDEKRAAPFQEKMGDAEWGSTLQIDPGTMRMVKDVLDAGDVAYRLSEKMGRDQPDYSEPTRREQIAQAIEADSPMAARRRFVTDALSNASDGLSRRQAIKTIMENS